MRADANEVKGYDADHRDIKLLRLKDFTIGRKLSDSDITAADGLQRIAGFIESMVPFVSFCMVSFSPFSHQRLNLTNLTERIFWYCFLSQFKRWRVNGIQIRPP